MPSDCYLQKRHHVVKKGGTVGWDLLYIKQREKWNALWFINTGTASNRSTHTHTHTHTHTQNNMNTDIYNIH